MGAALQLGYLFTFSLQDYIGIIIVFYGAFFWRLALFKGPVDLGRWRKMDPFWGIRLLKKKMQLHTSAFFFSFFCFPPGAKLWGCSILELERRWRKHAGKSFLCATKVETSEEEYKWVGSLWSERLKRSLPHISVIFYRYYWSDINCFIDLCCLLFSFCLSRGYNTLVLLFLETLVLCQGCYIVATATKSSCEKMIKE